MKRAITHTKVWLTNNVGMKIMAVLIAAVVWLAIVNINDPEKSIIIYNVPIKMTNEEAVTEQGMVYEVTSPAYVNITISGKRSIVSGLSSDDFVATASLEELSKVNAVPVEVTAKKNNISRNVSIIKQSAQTITVNIEKLEKRPFNIQVELAGHTARGYITGNYSSSKNTVNITAPVSVLDRIDKVAAVCNLDGSSSDITQACTIELYDKYGTPIKRKHTRLSAKKVTVTVDVLKETEVPVNAPEVGEPAVGYQVTSVKLSQKNVKLYGEEQALKDIDKIKIDEVIDVSGKTSDVITEIDLNKYLPEGIKIDGESTLKVTIKIEKFKIKSYTIKTSDIEINNLKDGAQVQFADDSVTILLQGKNEVIDSVKTSDISAGINLKDYEKGTVKVPLEINIPDGTELVKEITVKVKIK